MKLVIELNTEELVELVRSLDIDEVVATTPNSIEAKPTNPTVAKEPKPTPTNYIPTVVDAPGRQRKSSLQKAIDIREEELQRALTPEELGELEFQLEQRKRDQAKAKEDAAKKHHIEQVKKEVEEEIAKEESISEATSEDVIPVTEEEEEVHSPAPGSTVPKTQPLQFNADMFTSQR